MSAMWCWPDSSPRRWNINTYAQAGARSIRRIGRHLKKRQTEDEMNHQLLAGARDDQTAADAYINGDFHGAFTYYLCKTVSSMSSSSVNEVMETTVEEIRANGYGQIPQNEGPFGADRVFGGVLEEPPVIKVEPPLGSPTPSNPELATAWACRA